MDLPQDLKKGLVSICKYFHKKAEALSLEFLIEMGRHVYVTPTSYLELILTFKKVIEGKKEDTMNAKLRYLGGLEKLAFASGQIAIMKKELTALQPQLKEAARVTDEMMSVIERETKQVQEKSELVKEDEAMAHVQAEEATTLKTECLADLSSALPQLESRFLVTSSHRCCHNLLTMQFLQFECFKLQRP